MSLDTQSARQTVESSHIKGAEEGSNGTIHAEEIQTLLAVQRAITSRLEAGTVLQLIADEARRLSACEMSAVYLLKGDYFEVSVVSGAVDRSLLGYQLPVDGSIAGRAVQTGQALLVQDTLTYSGGFMPLVEKAGARSFLIVPLMSAGGALGTITVASSQPDRLGRDALRLLMMLSPGAVIALENARLYEQAQQAAALEERQRLARELHDAVTQTLFSANLIADVLPRLWNRDPQEGQARLDELRSLTRGALAELRSLLMALDSSPLLECDKEK